MSATHRRVPAEEKRKPQRIVVDAASRPPPFSREFEAAVLSSALGDKSGKTIDELSDLPVDDFYDEALRRMWWGACSLRDEGQPVDVVTLAQWLKEREWLQAVGGLTELARVIDAAPTVANVRKYADGVKAFAHARRVLETAQIIVGEGFGKTQAPDDFIAWAESEFGKALASGGKQAHAIESIGSIAKVRRAELEQMWAGKRDPWGLRGPFQKVNVITHGRHFGAFSLVGGFTSSGKSAYCMQEGLHIAGKSYLFPDENDPTKTVSADVAVLYLTLEMPKKIVMDRAVCTLARITIEQLRKGKNADNSPLDEDLRVRRDAAFRHFEALPFLVDDSDQSLESIVRAVRYAQAECRRLSRERGRPVRLGIVYLDHFHLTEENDEREVVSALGRLAKGLKRLAVRESIHVRALVQYNNDAPKRGERDVDSLPKNHDIKFGGAIMQAADQIEHVHRKWLSIEDKGSDEAIECENDAVVVIGKGRDGGGLGLVRLEFFGEVYTFAEPNREAA